MKIYRFLFILLLSMPFVGAYAQLPPNQPQQDCINAIPICQDIYVEPASYQGNGNSAPCNGLICNEITPPPSSCLGSGEKNAVWYTFTVQSTGLFGFNIIPNLLADDYDWAVYNLSNATCAQIATNPALEVACNYSGTPGITGCNLPAGSPITAQNNPVFSVVAGQTYVLVVSNFEDNPNNANGFTINLNPPPVIPPGGSALIVGDTASAKLVIVDTAIYCNRPIRVLFTERILRDSLTNSSFIIVSPFGTVSPVTNITCQNCSGGRGTQFTLFFDNDSSGNGYQLILIDSIPDACGNYAELDTVPFDILPRSLGFQLPRTSICLGDTITLSSSVSPVFPGEIFISQWSGGPFSPIAGNANAIRIFPNDTINPTGYYRVATLSNGDCPNSDSTLLTVFPPILPGQIFPKDSKLCFDDTLLLRVESSAFLRDATAGWVNLRYDNTPIQALNFQRDSVLFIPRFANRSYRITANLLNPGGCFNTSDTVSVVVGDDMSPEISVDTTTLDGVVPFTVQFNSTGTFSESSRWTYENTTNNPGSVVEFSKDIQPSFTFTISGNYRVVLEQIDSIGCIKTDEVFVIVRDLLLPNVITPNGDGSNDVFAIRGRNEGLKLVVYNRWGRSVYRNEDYKNDFSGIELEGGTYYYVLDDQVNQKSYNGWLQLIK